MAITYNTIEKISEVYFPYWEYTFPGLDGCISRKLLNTENSRLCPSSSKAYYEPISVQETRDDRRLNGRRSGYPPFRMTPRYVSRTITRNHLLRRRNGGNGLNRYFQEGIVSKGGGTTCVTAVTKQWSSGPVSAEWFEVAHSFTATEYLVNQFDQSEIAAASTKLQNDVANEALTSYDLLTECAEVREVPRLVASVSDDLSRVLRSLYSRFSLSDCRKAAKIRPLDLLRHPNRVLRKLGGEWMAYRYGIMPLVYSYRDIIKTMNRGSDVRNRSRITVAPKPTGVSLPGSTNQYKWSEYVGTVTLSATVFQHFTQSDIARLSGVGFNPLVTAWELIPYSFVIDWFVNVGSYIQRRTSRPFAGIRFACISQRSSYIKKTWVHYKADPKTVTFANELPVNWVGASPPTSPSKTIERPEESQLLKEVETQSYNRSTFPLNAAQIEVNPSLNWKRLTDLSVMSLNQLSALMKRLR